MDNAVCALACVPTQGLLRRQDDEATRAVLYWLIGEQDPPLLPELKRLVGPGYCQRGLAKTPACAGYYVQDLETCHAALQNAFQRYGYTASPDYGPGCPATEYISQLLAFVGHCMDDGSYDLMPVEDRHLLDTALFDWAPLFAQSLAGTSRHPAVVFAGIKLQSVITRH